MSDLYLGDQLIVRDFKEGQRVPISNLKPNTVYTVSLKDDTTVIDTTSFTTLAGLYMYFISPINTTMDASNKYNWWSLKELEAGRLSDKDGSIIADDTKSNPNTFYSKYYIPVDGAQAVTFSVNQLPANDDVEGLINAYDSNLKFLRTLATIKADGNSVEKTIALTSDISYIRFSLPWGLNNDFQQMVYLRSETDWNRLLVQGQSFLVNGKNSLQQTGVKINSWFVDLDVNPKFLTSDKAHSYFNGTYVLSGNIKGLSDYTPHSFTVAGIDNQGQEVFTTKAVVRNNNNYAHFTCELNFGDLNFNTLNSVVGLRLYTNKNGITGSKDCPAIFSNIRLEKGTIATQWQISPDSLKNTIYQVITKRFLNGSEYNKHFRCRKPFMGQCLWLVMSEKNYEVGDNYTTFSQSDNAKVTSDTEPNLILSQNELSREILPFNSRQYLDNLTFDNDYKAGDMQFYVCLATYRKFYLVELIQNNYFLKKEIVTTPPENPVRISQSASGSKDGSIRVSPSYLTTTLQLSIARGGLIVDFDMKGLNYVASKVTIGFFDGQKLDPQIQADFPVVNGHVHAYINLDTFLQGHLNYNSMVIYSADGGLTGSTNKEALISNLSAKRVASRNYLTNQNFIQGNSDSWVFQKDSHSWRVEDKAAKEIPEKTLTIPLNYKYPALDNTITVSFDTDSTSQILLTNFGLYDTNNNLVSSVGQDRSVTLEAEKVAPNGSRWQRVYLTYDISKLTPPKNSQANIYKLIFKKAANTTGYAEITNIKVEEGQGTNEFYTPAPEDLNNSATVYKVVQVCDAASSDLKNLTYQLSSPLSEGLWIMSGGQEHEEGDFLKPTNIENAYAQTLSSYTVESALPLYIRANNDYVKTSDLYNPGVTNVLDLKPNKNITLQNLNFSGFDKDFSSSTINALITR